MNNKDLTKAKNAVKKFHKQTMALRNRIEVELEAIERSFDDVTEAADHLEAATDRIQDAIDSLSHNG